MRTPRVHIAIPMHEGEVVELPPPATRHLVRVLRLEPDAPVILFNGQGGAFHAVLTETSRNVARARITEFDPREHESPLHLTLAQAVSKGERMDYTIQKAVELGVNAIVPLFTERAVVRLDAARAEKRQRHWQAVAISACEQCGRNRVPQVMAPVALQSWLQHGLGSGLRLILEPEGSTSLRALQGDDAVTVLVGPEGGFAPGEIARAAQAGFCGIRLGPRVLRTETAPVAILAAIQSLWGDLG